MKKSIFLFFAAILCATSAWAYDMNSAEIYYDNTASQWSDVQLFVGKSDWNSINPMKKISNTNNLYCLYNFSWGGYSAFYFTTGTASWNPLANNENVDSRSNWATCRSAKQTTNLGSTVNLYISTAATKDASVTRQQLTDYKSLNYKQTVQQQLTTDGSTYSASTEAIATIKVASYKLASADATSATANNGSITSGSSSAECEAARTATVTYSVTGVNSAYTFVGWYDGDTQKSTSSTYTYQATEAKTITARFAVATEEEHEVTITYVCGSNTVSAATSAYVGVETEKSFTAPTVTGYNFTGWTKGAGIIEKSSNENTITILTKTGETDYTLVANYEEVLETVYFINAGNWADVHIHLWNGTATDTEWPGTQLTATGTKIGEYDVYEYTAQQGAHANLLFHKKDNDSQKTTDLEWTAGKYYIHNYNGKTGWYTQAEAEEILVAPVVEETVYFVNNKNWTKVQVHAWKDAANNGWPGQALTATGEKVAGFDVYSFTATQGTYTNLLFNNKEGDAGVQSNNFVWTADKYYYMDAAADYAGGTAAEVEAALAAPVVEETVYFVNNKNWTKVQVHAWKDAANNGWPGQALTATGEKVAGFDVYSFTAAQGTYTNLLFNNKEGDAGVQSNNFVWADGKYYYMGAAADYAGGTKEDVTTAVAPDPLATDVYLAGEMNEWSDSANEFKKATAEATTASVTVNLTAKSYTFKLVRGGDWFGNYGTMQRGGNGVHEGGWSFNETAYEANCTIVADIAGDYTFTWNLTDKKLTVAYPPLPKHQVTATVNPAETGEVTGTGEYEQGSEATLVATPAAGYAFINWTVGGTEISTEATYTFTVNEPVSLVANFIPEVTHEVTVSYLCNSNPIPGHDATTLAVGVTTPSTITAPAITHYTFDGWTLGTGVQAVDANANPIQITTKAEGEYTLTANYTKIELTYTVKVPEDTEKCYIAGDMNSWSFQEMTPTANANEFTITIDGATTAHKYKYTCGEGWAYVEKKADGSDLDADRTYNANDVVAKWAEPAKCYLMGNGDWENGVEMTVNPNNENEFMLLNHHISAPFKFKYGEEWSDQVENYDFPGIKWENDNIELPEGIYDFYFKKDTKKAYIAAVYLRDVTNTWGTICLPHASTSFSGAKFYEVSSLDPTKGLWLDEIEAETQLVAGKPYVFEATASTIKVTYTDAAVDAPVPGEKGLTGTFTDIAAAEDGVLVGNYIIGGNKVHVATAQNDLPANRAYINAALVPNEVQAKIPGRRRVCMGENATTGFDQIVAPAGQAVKAIENGQLIIIRDGVKYNVQGQKL